MAKYYYLNAQNQQMGPVEKYDLIPCGVTRQTLVWTEGMAQWTQAIMVPDLADLFQAVPPSPGPVAGYGGVSPQPAPHQPYSEPPVNKPQSYMWLAILSTLLCCLPFGIVSIVYASKVDSEWARGDYEAAQNNSDKAKMWGIIAAAVGFVGGVIYGLFWQNLFWGF